jgi:hypothetical membrane protein
MRARLEPVGVACGVVAPFWFLSLYLTAMRMDHQYVFYRDYLSDLGVGRGDLAFNAAVIGAGLLTVAFALLGLLPAMGRRWPALGGVGMLAVGGSFLVCVGIFTEDAGKAHYVVSVGFFMSVLVALLLLSVTLWRTRALGRVAAWVTTATLTLGALMLLWGFDPQTETVAVLAEVVWGLSLAAIRLRGLLVVKTTPTN